MDIDYEQNSFDICKDIVEELIGQFALKNKNKDQNIENNLSPDTYIDNIKINEMNNFNFYKTVPQVGTPICGFHCLFNIINYLSYLKSQSDTEKSAHLSKMNSPVK
jgi:hypothetical protein